MSKNEKGFVPVVFIMVLGVLVIGASAASYYILKKAGKVPGSVNVSQDTIATPLPISDSDEVVDITEEFDTTAIDSLESDFKELEASISSL